MNVRITVAQIEVAECLAKGWTYSRTAEWLGIEPATVRSHVAHAVQRLPADFAPAAPMQKRLAFYYREHLAPRAA